MTPNPQYDRETCYFCHEPDTHLLESHHIVPCRFSGSDAFENLVLVCPNCHERLERLYDDRFYDALGVETESTDGEDSSDDTLPHPQYPLHAASEGRVTLKELIGTLQGEYSEGASYSRVFDEAADYGVGQDEVEAEIERLRLRGDVYEPQSDRLRTV